VQTFTPPTLGSASYTFPISGTLLPGTYYYMGRALEGLKSAGAADAYRSFLALKVPDALDPMVEDAKKRLSKM